MTSNADHPQLVPICGNCGLSDAMPLLIWAALPDGRINYCNIRREDYPGIYQDDDGTWHLIEAVHPDDQGRTLRAWAEAVRTETQYEIEHRLHCADGSYRSHLSRAVPARDANGALARWFGTSMDVESSKDIERELAAREAQYRRVAEAVPDIIWELDAEGHVRYLNARWESYTGMPAEAARDLGAMVAIHPRDAERYKQARDAVIASGQDRSAQPKTLDEEIRLRAADGSYRWFLVRGTAVHDAEGRLSGFFGTATDVDDARRHHDDREQLLAKTNKAWAEAEQVNKLKDEFLAVLSHELRTPLTTILGWSHLLQEGDLSGDRRAHGLQAIERGARSQAQMVEDLLDISRIMGGTFAIQPDDQPVNLADVVQATVVGLHPTLQAKQQTLSLRLPDHSVPITADSERLEHAILNIIANAGKFTPEHGHVDVELTVEGTAAKLRIADTGKGIRREFLPRLFDRFSQEDTSMSREHGGLGLGLTIARHVIQRHEGRIEAASEGEGRGAVFMITLPLKTETSTEPRPPVEEQEQPVANDQPLSGRTVLVVDDDETIRELTALFLQDAGAEVMPAETGAQAAEIYAARRPDLIVCDIGLPEEDGYSLIRRLRAMDHGSAPVPAVALTGYGGVENLRKSREAGFQAHLCKPIGPDRLVEALLRLESEQSEQTA